MATMDVTNHGAYTTDSDAGLVDLAATMWAEALWFLLGLLVIRAGFFSWLMPRKHQKVKQLSKGKHSFVERSPPSRTFCKDSPSTRKFHLACKSGKDTILSTLLEFGDNVPLPMDGAAILLNHCVETDDVHLADKIEYLVRKSDLQLTRQVFEPLLKLRARSCESSTVDLFQEMRRNDFQPTEGFCGGLLSRCADSKNLALADTIAEYLKCAGLTTLTSYKTLMKVFAYGDLPGRACAVYEQVIKEGLFPDQVMCACVMRFALKCGRLELLWDALSKSPPLDSQQAIHLIRTPGENDRMDHLPALICRLKEFHADSLDMGVYNSALELLVKHGEVAKAVELFQEISGERELDAKTYAIIVKGYCNEGHLMKAKQVLRDMQAGGHSPNTAVYNLLIGVATARKDCKEALQIIRGMDQTGVPVDQYTVSMMMKLAKQVQNPREVDKILALLDRQDVDICQDCVLLNTVLDVCVYHQDSQRLMRVLDLFEASGVSPSVQTYGLLIRACGFLGRTQRCQDLWEEMERCDIQPSTLSLGCMTDALVNADLVETAFEFVQRYMTTIPLNMVIISTLLKGFANTGQADRAMEMYRVVQSSGLTMNLVAWTTLINSQARVGNMDAATKLLGEMQEAGIEPNVVTYSTLIKGHCHNGNMDLALKVLQDMTDQGLALDVVVFNTLLDGCVRHSHFDLADQFLANMDSHKIAPSNFTLSIIIKLRGKQRRLDRAFQAVRTMPKQYDFSPDAKVGTCLLAACFCNNAPDRAMEAFEEMKTWRQTRGFAGPDENSYSTLIQGLARARCFAPAVEYAQEACGLGGKPVPAAVGTKGLRHQTLATLIREMDFARPPRQHEELLQIFKSQLRAAGIKAAGCH